MSKDPWTRSSDFEARKKAHKAQFGAAKKGKGPPPPYLETSTGGCLLALLMLPLRLMFKR